MSKEQCLNLIERLNVVIAHRNEMCEGNDPSVDELIAQKITYMNMLSVAV